MNLWAFTVSVAVGSIDIRECLSIVHVDVDGGDGTENSNTADLNSWPRPCLLSKTPRNDRHRTLKNYTENQRIHKLFCMSESGARLFIWRCLSYSHPLLARAKQGTPCPISVNATVGCNFNAFRMVCGDKLLWVYGMRRQYAAQLNLRLAFHLPSLSVAGFLLKHTLDIVCPFLPPNVMLGYSIVSKTSSPNSSNQFHSFFQALMQVMEKLLQK
jgi:hypothetical protein